MKVQYFAAIASILLLSLGAMAGCANPCAAKTQTPDSTEVQVSPNPCASKTNPCASKTNPCASKTNPCAGQTN